MVFRVASRGGKGAMHAFADLRSEIAVVLRIDPQHGYACRAAEFAGHGNHFVRRAVVVWLAVDPAAAPRGKGDDRANRWWVSAGQRNRSKAAARLAHDNDL